MTPPTPSLLELRVARDVCEALTHQAEAGGNLAAAASYALVWVDLKVRVREREAEDAQVARSRAWAWTVRQALNRERRRLGR